MTKSELVENYTVEQLAEMVIVAMESKEDDEKMIELIMSAGKDLEKQLDEKQPEINLLKSELMKYQNASEVKSDEIQKLKWRISNLEEDNGRLQAKLDTYNNYLFPRCTKEAKELIDQNHFTGVRIVTLEQWNNREESEEKGSVYIPKEYEQTMREILDIDTSKIQDDCHRFGIENLQRYLKIPAPIKIPKRDSGNMDLSKIRKCQEEYEKVLKESPLDGVMNKIAKDILEQKNNAMAMEFTRIICDLLKRYGVHVHCTETKLSENITRNSIEETYGIAFDRMDFSQHDKEFTDEIRELKSQIDRSQNTINQIDEILEKLFGVRHDFGKPDEFEKILNDRIKRNVTDFLTTEPIKVADVLINAEGEYERNPLAKKICGTDKGTYRIFEVSELRQIAEHLLIYCNHHGDAEE